MYLEAFTQGQLQDFKAILSVLEVEGVTDLPTARQRIDDETRRNRLESRREVSAMKVKNLCPDCGRKMVRRFDDDGVGYLICAKCRYSEVLK